MRNSINWESPEICSGTMDNGICLTGSTASYRANKKIPQLYLFGFFKRAGEGEYDMGFQVLIYEVSLTYSSSFVNSQKFRCLGSNELLQDL